MEKTNFDDRAYIVCALWSTLDGSTPSGGYPLDKNYSPADIDQATLTQMVADCKDFQDSNTEALVEACAQGGDPERNGHDFWLTRNRHGVGFWDRGYQGEFVRHLVDNAHAYGSYDLYVGDDKKIHGN
jgi:hypothetical protein